jgi:hypothetical protein
LQASDFLGDGVPRGTCNSVSATGFVQPGLFVCGEFIRAGCVWNFLLGALVLVSDDSYDIQFGGTFVFWLLLLSSLLGFI